MNTKFTIRNNPAVDRFVKEHLDIITHDVQQLIGNDLVAIVLTGGFGRGEGSVYVRPDGSMHIVNDYDIEVVYRESYGAFPSKLIAHLRYSRGLIRLADRLSEALDIKQIDLCLRGESSYTSSHPPLLADYDTRKGSILLFGNRNPVDSMPDYDSHDIPAFEGTWLLRNRGIGLLLASFYLKDGVLQGGKEEYFHIEINKAILAMGDALFIASGTYHHSYTVRAEQIDTVIPHGMNYSDELGSYYKAAAQQKLLPQDNPFPEAPPSELWNRINEIYCDFFLYYESRRLDRNFDNISDYAETQISGTTAPSIKQKLKVLFEKLRGTLDNEAAHIAHIKHDKASTIVITFLLLSARNTDNIDSKLVQQAYKIANLDTPHRDDRQNWQSLTRAFLLMAHPKGELGRALRIT